MSASNWAICPRCLKDAREKFDEAKAKVGALYGQIPAEDYIERREALKRPNPEDYRTFREDYEFHGAQDGEVVASYSGGCSKCGLNVDFEERRRFWP